MAYEYLMAPFKLKNLEFKNRVILPSMATGFVERSKGGAFVTDRFINYHVARAKGGVAMNITEAVGIHGPTTPAHFLGISDDKFISGFKRFTDAIHAVGGKACIQLWQGAMTAHMVDMDTDLFYPNDVEFGGANALGTNLPYQFFKGASVEKIQEVVKCFGEAAKRSVDAGFDAIEFHSAHNYAPHVFFSPPMNHRTDEYGGSFENRIRFAKECVIEIRKNMPEDMPLLMRTNSRDDGLEGGLTPDDVAEYCSYLQKYGVDMISISRGGSASEIMMAYAIPPIDVERGFNVDNAAYIKGKTGIVTSCCGRINDPDQADGYIRDGKLDFITMGRANIADPEFCNKVKEGRVDDIVRCFGCCQGCIDRYSRPTADPISCTMNQSVGKEAEFAPKQTENPKKVLIVGGGIAGMEAAIDLKRNGHNPIIVEEKNTLGGQFWLAGVAPRKQEMHKGLEDRCKLTYKEGIDVRLNTKFSNELVDEIKPDMVIFANGSTPNVLNIPGKNLGFVNVAHDVLSGKVERPKGNIVIIGGGLVGLEVAEYLEANDKKSHITILEMLPEVGMGLGLYRKLIVMSLIAQSCIETHANTKCIAIEEGKIRAIENGKEVEYPCDAVVMAIGSTPVNNDAAIYYLRSKGIHYDVVGDAHSVSQALEAVEEAAIVAHGIK
jgi:2,4-dienoyl-CoA reductase-like NADH-dependent reductase (Old Yellow Enzyme family)/NADPH-dependent 2,4-dienoyl-CoA reductase/sulfur reductase-like enzyme